jgi:hypothetical protein
MTRTYTFQIGILVALTPCCAWASDPTGLATILFGIPGLVLALGLALFLRALPRTRALQIAVKIIYYPLLLLAALVSLDAIAMAMRSGWEGKIACVVYFSLLGLLLFLLRRLLFPAATGETPTPL